MSNIDIILYKCIFFLNNSQNIITLNIISPNHKIHDFCIENIIKKETINYSKKGI